MSDLVCTMNSNFICHTDVLSHFFPYILYSPLFFNEMTRSSPVLFEKKCPLIVIKLLLFTGEKSIAGREIETRGEIHVGCCRWR